MPQLWVCEFHHVHFKYLRAGRASNEWFGFSVLDEPGGPAFRYGHALQADRASQYSVDLDGPMRLLFEPTEHPPPTLASSGGIDWQQVNSVRLLEIRDTHG